MKVNKSLMKNNQNLNQTALNFLEQKPSIEYVKKGISKLDKFLEKEEIFRESMFESMNAEVKRIDISHPEDTPDEIIAEKQKTLIFQLYESLLKINQRYFKFHSNFFSKELLEYYEYATKWQSINTLKNIIKEFSNKGTTCRKRATDFFQKSLEFYTSLDDRNELISEVKDKNDIAEIREKRKSTLEKINALSGKVNKVYDNNIGILDMIFDSQFILLYVIKSIRVFFIYASLIITVKIFQGMYLKQVYAQGKEPPNILYMLLIFIGIDFFMNLFLMLTLLLVYYLFKTHSNMFIVDSYLLKKQMVDYILVTFVNACIAALIGNMIMKKKYFKYKYEGPRGIRAFQEVIFQINSLLMTIPFFLLV